MTDIEIVKRNGPKRIGIILDGSSIRRLTVMEAVSLMVHLGAVIDWANAKEAGEALTREVEESNRKGNYDGH